MVSVSSPVWREQGVIMAKITVGELSFIDGHLRYIEPWEPWRAPIREYPEHLTSDTFQVKVSQLERIRWTSPIFGCPRVEFKLRGSWYDLRFDPPVGYSLAPSGSSAEEHSGAKLLEAFRNIHWHEISALADVAYAAMAGSERLGSDGIAKRSSQVWKSLLSGGSKTLASGAPASVEPISKALGKLNALVNTDGDSNILQSNARLVLRQPVLETWSATGAARITEYFAALRRANIAFVGLDDSMNTICQHRSYWWCTQLISVRVDSSQNTPVLFRCAISSSDMRIRFITIDTTYLGRQKLAPFLKPDPIGTEWWNP